MFGSTPSSGWQERLRLDDRGNTNDGEAGEQAVNGCAVTVDRGSVEGFERSIYRGRERGAVELHRGDGFVVYRIGPLVDCRLAYTQHMVFAEVGSEPTSSARRRVSASTMGEGSNGGWRHTPEAAR